MPSLGDEASKFPPTSVFHFIDDQDSPVNITVQQMRSMTYHPMQDAYTVFYTTRTETAKTFSPRFSIIPIPWFP